jgi:alkanesulfonate monooxygenase SsuD/methylene tetrahydromethanopterin reductase-like flavin-dependent oxidoreductase (luciferase family)
MSIALGVFLNPAAAGHAGVVEQAKAADSGGLDLIGIQDHPYQRRFLDTFALIADLLARTQRISIFPDVANLPLRPPLLLAKQAASLGVMSAGRFELGLGAGAFWDGVEAMGGQRRTPGESVDALDDAIDQIRGFWAGEHQMFGPPPAHPIGIWIGAYKPRMLALTGRKADGWLPSLGYAPPDQIPELAKRIDDAAQRAGRDPGAIRRLYNVSGTIADGPATGLLEGPPDHWAASLAELAQTCGFDGFIVSPAQGDEVRQIERLAAEVAPALRAAAG